MIVFIINQLIWFLFYYLYRFREVIRGRTKIGSKNLQNHLWIFARYTWTCFHLLLVVLNNCIQLSCTWRMSSDRQDNLVQFFMMLEGWKHNLDYFCLNLSTVKRIFDLFITLYICSGSELLLRYTRVQRSSSLLWWSENETPIQLHQCLGKIFLGGCFRISSMPSIWYDC